MKKVLLDENLPQPLRHRLRNCEVSTVGFMGWSGVQNGELIELINGDFDILVTADQNLRYQQNLKDRLVSIIELPATRLEEILRFLSELDSAIENAEIGGYTVIR